MPSQAIEDEDFPDDPINAMRAADTEEAELEAAAAAANPTVKMNEIDDFIENIRGSMKRLPSLPKSFVQRVVSSEGLGGYDGTNISKSVDVKKNCLVTSMNRIDLPSPYEFEMGQTPHLAPTQ